RLPPSPPPARQLTGLVDRPGAPPALGPCPAAGARPRPAAGAPAAEADHAPVPVPPRRRGVQPRRRPPRGDRPGRPHLRRRPPVSTPSRPRILFSRPDHVGDVLLTLPAVAALRRALPDARIGFLVPPSAAAIPQRCADVDVTYTAPFP